LRREFLEYVGLIGPTKRTSDGGPTFKNDSRN